MAIKDLLQYLSYSKCECSADVREDLGIVNGICPKHPKSELLVNGIRVNVFLKEVERRKRFDRKGSEIV